MIEFAVTNIELSATVDGHLVPMWVGVALTANEGKQRKPNTVLRRLREEVRHQTREEFALSMARAAAEIGENCACSWRYVAHLEDGTVSMPGPAYRRILERATGLPFAELGWTTRRPMAADPQVSSDGEASGEEPCRATATWAELLPPETEALTSAFGPGGRQVGTEVVADLMGRAHALRLADDVIYGEDLIGPAFRDLRYAVRLYRESTHTEKVGHSLLTAIGEFAQIAGWIASDAGHGRQAEQAYRLGISAAMEAGNGTLAGNLMGSLAYHHANNNRPSDAVTLSQAGLQVAGPRSPARARALSHDRAAWAHTKARNAQGAMKELQSAADALVEHEPGADEPGYLYWVDAGELKVMEARAFTELRRPLRAVPLLTDVLGRYALTHTREMALYLSWLAEAYIHANEPEQAAATAERMIDISRDITSRRTTSRVRVVLNHLRPLGNVPAVGQLLDTHGHMLAT